MDQIHNPFAPGAGTPPPELVGREDILENARITIARVRDGRPAKSFLLVGLRGVGKTVLLNRVQDMSEAKGFKTIFVEATEQKKLAALLLPPLRQILLALDRLESMNEYVKRSLRVLKSFANAVKISVNEFDVGLDIDAEVGTADSGDLESDLTDLLIAVAQAGAARKKPVIIIIDEMQYLNERELSALIMAIHKVCQKMLPLILVGAGLPQLVGQMGKSQSYAERLFDFPVVGALRESDAKMALERPARREGASFYAPALHEIIKITQGFPYFIQMWGYHTWNLAEVSPITLVHVQLAHPYVVQHLDENFFRVRFDRITPREREYLRAMAELGSGPQRSGDIADILGVDVHSIAPCRSTLIKKGMIYSPAHGDAIFTVPLFDEFMKRMMPEMPWKKSR